MEMLFHVHAIMNIAGNSYVYSIGTINASDKINSINIEPHRFDDMERIDKTVKNRKSERKKVPTAKMSFNKANRVTECDKEKRNEIEK